jgi:hypothetical protein
MSQTPFYLYPTEARPVRHPLHEPLEGDPATTQNNRWCAWLAQVTSVDNPMTQATLRSGYVLEAMKYAREVHEIVVPAGNQNKPAFTEVTDMGIDKPLGHYQCDYILQHVFQDNKVLGFDKSFHGPGILKPGLDDDKFDKLPPHLVLNHRRKMAVHLLEIAVLMTEKHNDPSRMGRQEWIEYGNKLAAEAEAAAHRMLQGAGALPAVAPAIAPPNEVVGAGVAIGAANVAAGVAGVVAGSPGAAAGAAAGGGFVGGRGADPGRAVGSGRGGRNAVGRGGGRGDGTGGGRGDGAGGGRGGSGGAIPPTLENMIFSFVNQFADERTEKQRSSAAELLLLSTRLAVPLEEVVTLLDQYGISREDPPALIGGMIAGLPQEFKLSLAQCLKAGPKAFFCAAFGI